MSHNRKRPHGHEVLVKDHYNVKKESNRSDRNKSQIIVLRSFNNWIKQIQIENSYQNLRKTNSPDIFEERFNSQTNTVTQRCKGLTVLDWCCGKGGDQSKWKKIPVRHIDFVDISDQSIAECESRYNKNKQCRDKYSANFYVQDCCKPVVHDKLNRQYDIVSCQFAIHYAFESCEKAEQMIKNISDRLKPDAVFIGTTVNDMELMARARQNLKPDKAKQEKLPKPYKPENVYGENQSSSEEEEESSNSLLPTPKTHGYFGNRVYSIKFDDSIDIMNPPLFGCKYDFDLDGLITVPEFMVNKQLFIAICDKFDLEVVYYDPFRNFFTDAAKNEKHRYLLGVFKALQPFNERSYMFNVEIDEGMDFDRPRKAVQQLINKGKENFKEHQIGTMSMTDWEAATLYSAFCFRKRGVTK